VCSWLALVSGTTTSTQCDFFGFYRAEQSSICALGELTTAGGIVVPGRHYRSAGELMIFAGIVGFVVVTFLVTALVLKGNGDSIKNYL
jgi:hypothetical protein